MDCLQALFFVQISVIFSSGCPEKVRRNHLQTIKEDWKMTDKEKQQIKALRESGESYAQISKMMDLPINSIKTYCRRNNLTSIDVEKEDKTSTCLECGKPIEQTPGRKKKKFCSDKCSRTGSILVLTFIRGLLMMTLFRRHRSFEEKLQGDWDASMNTSQRRQNRKSCDLKWER